MAKGKDSSGQKTTADITRRLLKAETIGAVKIKARTGPAVSKELMVWITKFCPPRNRLPGEVSEYEKLGVPKT